MIINRHVLALACLALFLIVAFLHPPAPPLRSPELIVVGMLALAFGLLCGLTAAYASGFTLELALYLLGYTVALVIPAKIYPPHYLEFSTFGTVYVLLMVGARLGLNLRDKHAAERREGRAA